MSVVCVCTLVNCLFVKQSVMDCMECHNKRLTNFSDVVFVRLPFYIVYFYFYDLARGGWKPRPGQQQKNKSNFSILRQEKLIAEKKKEIEARLSEQAKMSVQAPSKPQSPR